MQTNDFEHLSEEQQEIVKRVEAALPDLVTYLIMDEGGMFHLALADRANPEFSSSGDLESLLEDCPPVEDDQTFPFFV